MSKFYPIQKGMKFFTGSYPNVVIDLGSDRFMYAYKVRNQLRFSEVTFFYWEKMAKKENGQIVLPLFREGKQYL